MKKIYAMGNALVDILAQSEDDFLAAMEIKKGIMTLVDDQTQARIMEKLYRDGHHLELACGGSVCNSAVVLAALGLEVVFCGKTAADREGEFYRQDLREYGVTYATPLSSGRSGTSLVLTTPDGERSMLTNLGVSIQLGPEDIREQELKECQALFIEGYLWDSPSAREACLRALELAKKYGIKTIFSFSDPFLIERGGESLHQTIMASCDLVFCNLDEARHFHNLQDVDELAAAWQKSGKTVFMTLGSRGACVVANNQVQIVPTSSNKLVDTTGAGDMFAAGALWAMAQNLSFHSAAKAGNILAGNVIGKMGPRLSSRELEDLRPQLAQLD